MHTIPESVLSEITSLVSSVRPASGYWLTRHDEPMDDTVYPSEDAARDAVEASQDNPRERDQAHDFAPVSIQLTIGYSPDSQTWGSQTGDNSFTGGAYGHPVWGVAYLSADSDPSEVAQEIVDDIESQLADMA